MSISNVGQSFTGAAAISAPASGAPVTPGGGAEKGAKSGVKEFAKVLDELNLEKSPGGGDLHAELMKVEKRVLDGGTFQPQELLRFQIIASRFGVAVELITKVADGALQTTKKFQQAQ